MSGTSVYRSDPDADEGRNRPSISSPSCPDDPFHGFAALRWSTTPAWTRCSRCSAPAGDRGASRAQPYRAEVGSIVARDRWLAERRSAVEIDYTTSGPTYDDGYDPATPTHRGFVSRIIELVPSGGSVLDAACGTAPYAGMILDAGLDYTGVDQSTGSLQELSFDGRFDALVCTDAMENVPPEDWPRVLGGFTRALRPDGYLYLTVEEIDVSEVDDAFAAAVRQGLPTVLGEVIEGDTAGYHFYPDRPRVERWTTEAGFRLVAQEDEWLDEYGYHHLLLQRSPIRHVHGPDG
jgi:ubiquinone/menaquinone biosynthesis C-methylase UbiE